MKSFPSYPPTRWSFSALWSSCALAVFVALGATSGVSWMILGVVALIPPAVFLALWNEGPPPTVAEVIRATEDRR
jgi:hypothetical protein